MRSCNVALRESDVAAIALITAYLRRHGLLVGKRTVSQAVRYALDMTSETIARYNEIEGVTNPGTVDHRGGVIP